MLSIAKAMVYHHTEGVYIIAEGVSHLGNAVYKAFATMIYKANALMICNADYSYFQRLINKNAKQ